MFQQFVNRDAELKSLNDFYKSRDAQLIVIYGRRRVGKTELIKEFIKNKPHIYYLSDQRKERYNIEELKAMMADFLKDSLFAKAELSGWTELFKEFRNKLGNRKIVLVIDEFPYLIKSNHAVTSLFQKIWDEYIKDSQIYLILCGSSISMMEKEVLESKSPLYGRRTGQWKIEPLEFKYMKEFFPRYSTSDLIKTYSVLDSIPLYLHKFNPKESLKTNILTKILRKGEFLFQEAEFLLKDELREPGNYFMILKAIAHGESKFGNIINYSGLDKTMVSKYLDTLLKLHIIKKEYPVTERKEKTRDTLYGFEDNYFKFWFRFVYPNRAAIEEGRTKELFDSMAETFNCHVSFVFERVAKYILSRRKIFPYTRIGRWWNKEKEIDIVAVNENKQIMFAECKWKEKVNPKKLLTALKAKAASVKWKNDKREEHYCLFAKSFQSRIKENNTYLFDLNDIQKLVESRL